MTPNELAPIAGSVPHTDDLTSSNLLFDVIAVPLQQISFQGAGNTGKQRGTTVRATLPLRTRKLYEWMIEPLIMAKERQKAHGAF